VNVTVPGAHHPVNTEALFAGLPVLCEKPIAPTVAQALSLAAASEASGQLLMTSQSRRYFASLSVFRDQVRSLGQLGIATTEFFKAPRFGGFRDEMDHVLLVDMAIHSFDAARYVLDSDPVAVYCEEFNPAWSWYSGAASAAATFEFENGIRYVYTGSWCSDGLETSWNGSWRVNGSRGSASWDGESTARIQTPDDGTLATAVVSPSAREEIRGSLAEFVAALRSGTQPSGEIHSNILSLAMVEGAVRSAEQGERILIQTILDDAYAQALAQEARSDVLTMLSSWGAASNGLNGDGQRMPLLAPTTSGG
jgi:predicted dehydrogenase